MSNEAFSIKIPNFWAWADNLGSLVFGHSRPIHLLILVQWVLCPCLPLINHYFYKKSLYPKYLFGIRIWIWAAKNEGFSHRVSVVRVWESTSNTCILMFLFIDNARQMFCLCQWVKIIFEEVSFFQNPQLKQNDMKLKKRSCEMHFRIKIRMTFKTWFEPIVLFCVYYASH